MKQEDPMLKVLGKLDDLTTEVKALRSDVSATKSDVIMQGFQLKTAETRAKAMQTDLSDLKKDVGVVKKDIGSLKNNVKRLEVLHEETIGTIERTHDVVKLNSEQLTKMDKRTEKQDDTILFHERRIGFLEKKVA